MFFSLRPNPFYLPLFLLPSSSPSPPLHPPLPFPLPIITFSPTHNTRHPEPAQGEFLTFPMLFYFRLTQAVNKKKITMEKQLLNHFLLRKCYSLNVYIAIKIKIMDMEKARRQSLLNVFIISFALLRIS